MLAVLVSSGGHHGQSWAALGVSLGGLGPLSGPLWQVLGCSRGLRGRSCEGIRRERGPGSSGSEVLKVVPKVVRPRWIRTLWRPRWIRTLWRPSLQFFYRFCYRWPRQQRLHSQGGSKAARRRLPVSYLGAELLRHLTLASLMPTGKIASSRWEQ